MVKRRWWGGAAPPEWAGPQFGAEPRGPEGRSIPDCPHCRWRRRASGRTLAFWSAVSCRASSVGGRTRKGQGPGALQNPRWGPSLAPSPPALSDPLLLAAWLLPVQPQGHLRPGTEQELEQMRGSGLLGPHFPRHLGAWSPGSQEQRFAPGCFRGAFCPAPLFVNHPANEEREGRWQGGEGQGEKAWPQGDQA